MKVNFYNIVSMISVDAAKVQPVLRSTRRMRKCVGWWEMPLARQGERSRRSSQQSKAKLPRRRIQKVETETREEGERFWN